MENLKIIETDPLILSALKKMDYLNSDLFKAKIALVASVMIIPFFSPAWLFFTFAYYSKIKFDINKQKRIIENRIVEKKSFYNVIKQDNQNL